MNKLLFKDWKLSRIMYLKRHWKMWFMILISFYLGLSFITYFNFEISLFHIYAVVILIHLNLVLINYPFFYLKPPHLATSFYSGSLKNIFYRKYALLLVKTLMWVILIYFVNLSFFYTSYINLADLLNLFIFMIVSRILSWVFCNEDKPILQVLLIFIISSFALFVSLLLNIAILLLSLRWLIKMEINLEKFINYSKALYGLEQAYIRGNHAEIMAISYSLREAQSYIVTLGKTLMQGEKIIISKDIVQIFRQPKVTYIVMSILLFFSIKMYEYNYIVSVFLQASFMSSVTLASCRRMYDIINKKREGLLVPFSDYQICYISSLLSIIIVTIYLFTLTFIIENTPIRYIVANIVVVVTLLITHKIYLKFNNYEPLINTLNLAVYLLILLLIFN